MWYIRITTVKSCMMISMKKSDFLIPLERRSVSWKPWLSYLNEPLTNMVVILSLYIIGALAYYNMYGTYIDQGFLLIQNKWKHTTESNMKIYRAGLERAPVLFTVKECRIWHQKDIMPAIAPEQELVTFHTKMFSFSQRKETSFKIEFCPSNRSLPFRHESLYVCLIKAKNK